MKAAEAGAGLAAAAEVLAAGWLEERRHVEVGVCRSAGSS